MSIILQCNFLYKVWKNVENFPHVVFFATSRGIFFTSRGKSFLRFLRFFNILVFWYWKIITGVEECKTEICHTSRDAACCVRKSKSKSKTQNAKHITHNTKLQTQFQLALRAATSDNSKPSGRCPQRPYPYSHFSFLLSSFLISHISHLLSHFSFLLSPFSFIIFNKVCLPLCAYLLSFLHPFL